MKDVSKISGFYTNQENLKRIDYFPNYTKRKKMVKPPFKRGLYSYKQSNGYIKNLNNKNAFSYESPNYSGFNIKKDKNQILNIYPVEGNSSLSISSINLNKYKIYNIPEKIHEKINKTETKQIIHDNNELIKNPNLSMNLNMNMDINSNSNINKNIENNSLINSKINIEYYNYYNDSAKYEKENRRMIIELIKVKLGLKKNNNIRVKQFLEENKISLKVLNQRLSQKEYENEIHNNNNSNLNSLNNKEVFGEEKKLVYLKNLDNYFPSHSSTITTEIMQTNNNKINKVFDIENSMNYKNRKKTNILNFLLTPRVLNLIEELGEKQKYVFLISLDEIFYLQGKESYIFMWKNMENNEIENEFNIKLIKNCEVNKTFSNRFVIKVENEEFEENSNYEIETPSEEICNYYIICINYLLSKK